MATASSADCLSRKHPSQAVPAHAYQVIPSVDGSPAAASLGIIWPPQQNTVSHFVVFVMVLIYTRS